MATDDDRITDAILSDSPYEQLRAKRHSYFSQPVTRKLVWQSVLLGALALLLPIYVLLPSSVSQYLPATDPAIASPKVLLLGVYGAVAVLLASIIFVGTALYRIRHYPLTSTQARTTLNVEEFASYIGFCSGGIAIGLTLLFFLLGMAGETAMEGYLTSMTERNPFAASGVGLSVTELAMSSFMTCLGVLAIRIYISYRLYALTESQ